MLSSRSTQFISKHISKHFSTYALGTKERELKRLGIQHDAFKETTSALYDSINITPGDHVIDLGCGPGFTTIELAKLVGATGNVYAMDQSLESLTNLSKNAISIGYTATSSCRLEHQLYGDILLKAGDVTQKDTWQLFETIKVDKIFCRWLLCWLKHDEVIRIHNLFSSSIKANANSRVAIMDYYNIGTFAISSSNETPHWDYLRDVLLTEWNRVGNPSVCSQVPQLLHANGFQIQEIKPVSFIIRPQDSMWIWPTTYFQTQAKRLVENNVIQDINFVQKFETEWKTISSDPATHYIPPTMATIVGEKC